MQYSYQFSRRAAAGMGVDASATPPSPRSCATPTTSPTASTCAATSSSRRGSPRRASTRAAHALDGRDGRGRPRDRHASCIMATGLPLVAQHARVRRPRHASRARPTTPATGRMRASTSPASASASSAPARRRSSRSRSSPSRPSTSRCSSAPPTTPCRRTTRRSIRPTCGEVKADYAACAGAPRRCRPASTSSSTTASAVETPEEERQRQFEERWDHGGLRFMGAFSDLLLERRVATRPRPSSCAPRSARS